MFPISTDKDIPRVLQQVLGLLIARIDGDELHLLKMQDDTVIAEDDASGRSRPQQSSVSSAVSGASRQGCSGGSHRSSLTSIRHARPGPWTLERPASRKSTS